MYTILLVLILILLVIQYYQYHYQTQYYEDLDRRFCALINSIDRNERKSKNNWLQSEFACEHVDRLNRICKTANECQLNELSEIIQDMSLSQSAFLIALIEPGLVAKVLPLLPEDRVANIIDDLLTGSIDGFALGDVKDIMARLHEVHEKSTAGNMLSVAELFYFSETQKEKDLITTFSDVGKYPNLKPYLLNWHDVVNINDRIVQTVLREVSNENLIYALFGSSDEVVDKFLTNMSKRAEIMLRKDLASLRDVSEKDVISGRKALLFAIVKDTMDFH